MNDIYKLTKESSTHGGEYELNNIESAPRFIKIVKRTPQYIVYHYLEYDEYVFHDRIRNVNTSYYYVHQDEYASDRKVMYGYTNVDNMILEAKRKECGIVNKNEHLYIYHKNKTYMQYHADVALNHGITVGEFYIIDNLVLNNNKTPSSYVGRVHVMTPELVSFEVWKLVPGSLQMIQSSDRDFALFPTIVHALLDTSSYSRYRMPTPPVGCYNDMHDIYFDANNARFYPIRDGLISDKAKRALNIDEHEVRILLTELRSIGADVVDLQAPQPEPQPQPEPVRRQVEETPA